MTSCVDEWRVPDEVEKEVGGDEDRGEPHHDLFAIWLPIPHHVAVISDGGLDGNPHHD